MPRIDVRSIQILDDLRQRLGLFQAELEDAVREMEAAIQQGLRRLYERERYWQHKKQIAQEEYNKAWAALMRCQQPIRTSDGKTYVPPCIAERARLKQAGIRLREVTKHWEEIAKRRQRAEQAAETFQRRARYLIGRIQEEFPKAQVQLKHQLQALRGYTALSSPAEGAIYTAASLSSTSLQTTSPSQAVQSGHVTGLTLVAMGAGAIGVSLLRQLGDSLRRAPDEVGELLTTELASQDLGLQELPLDPPKYGFDRAFRTPNGRIVILESKARGAGRQRLNQTKTMEEQGSPERITARTKQTPDPVSVEWGPVSKRFEALLQEVDGKNVAVAVVVLDTDAGRASVYVRRPGEQTWKPLQEGISLETVPRIPAAPDLQEIPLAQIDWEEMDEPAREEYRKVGVEEMRAGLHKLIEVVRPAVQRGATAEDFSRMDEEQGLDYAHGYRRIYDAFYGPNESIVLEKVGERYQVINGRHRLMLAREMGISTLPARIYGRLAF